MPVDTFHPQRTGPRLLLPRLLRPLRKSSAADSGAWKPVEVVRASSPKEMEQFLSLPWSIYRHIPNWVPPLRREARKQLREDTNPLLRCGPHAFFLAYRNGEPVGRICAGVNRPLNIAKGVRDGYFCLFESVEDHQVAGALLDQAAGYLVDLGVQAMLGPVSPTNGDEFRGLLVDGFQHRPMLFQSYNPPYYRDLLECHGFSKEMDYLAYRYDSGALPERDRAIAYAKRRYGFDTFAVDPRRLERDLGQMKRVVEEAMPGEWDDLIPPGMDELERMAAELRPVAVPELIRIARQGERPVGFSVSLPDYNQLLARMNGRLFPTGWLTWTLGRRRIDAIRMFIMFVVPEFHGKGVLQALHYSTVKAAVRLGYRWGEASTVHETNGAVRREAEAAGGVPHKVYRVYRKPLAPQDAALKA